MKKCPKCAATFGDDMAFCLNDGTGLVDDAPPLPETVVFNPQQSQLTQINPPATPTSPSAQTQQTYQQPQYGHQITYDQPSFTMPQQPSGSKFGVGKVIAAAVVAFLGLIVLIGGVIGVFIYSRSGITKNTNASPTLSSSPSPGKSVNNGTPETNSKTDDQDVSQVQTKNGFKQVQFEDVTSRGFFPGANKTSAATFDDGSNRVVSFASAYDTSSKAESAYDQLLEDEKKNGNTITSKGSTYAYYSKTGSYSVALYSGNKVYVYSAKRQDVLYKFAK